MDELARAAQREYARQWRKKNLQKVRNYAKKWRENNPEKVRESQERYWQRKAEEMGIGDE